MFVGGGLVASPHEGMTNLVNFLYGPFAKLENSHVMDHDGRKYRVNQSQSSSLVEEAALPTRQLGRHLVDEYLFIGLSSFSCA
jgi:hypothetical protein